MDENNKDLLKSISSESVSANPRLERVLGFIENLKLVFSEAEISNGVKKKISDLRLYGDLRCAEVVQNIIFLEEVSQLIPSKNTSFGDYTHRDPNPSTFTKPDPTL